MPSKTLLPPAKDVEEGPYDLKTLDAPVMRGVKLKLFVTLAVESPLFALVKRALFKKSGLPQVLNDVDIPELPKFFPEPLFPQGEYQATPTLAPTSTPKEKLNFALKSVTSDFFTPSGPLATTPRPTVRDYHKAYKEGLSTPTQVANNIIKFLKDRDLHWLIAYDEKDILLQAEAATKRYSEGQPLSVLDGVPFAVKDTVDAAPYRTTCGTAYYGTWREPGKDFQIVTSLKSLGAVLLGKTNMNEIGLGVTGINTVHGTPVNPWAEGHCCGGSSSGSGAVVGSGLCPIAIASDGGGSLRVPSSFCGAVTLMASRGRLSHEGTCALDFTVAEYGPVAGCVDDAMITYSLLCDVPSTPPIALPERPPAGPQNGKPLRGLTMGIYWQWFNDANSSVVEVCTRAVRLLEELGVSLKAINIPDLELLRVAHTCTIASEMAQAFNRAYNGRKWRSRMNNDIRVSLGIARAFTAKDYVQAQRIRGRMMVHFKRVLSDVDFLVTPTVPITAPPVHPTALKTNESNVKLTSTIMRFMAAANFLGLPAMSLPVGHDEKHLPI
eukprot:evm.model.scf_3152.2 EVM.evm.TU.scf_3152.2   scf_3152:9825-15920(+)